MNAKTAIVCRVLIELFKQMGLSPQEAVTTCESLAQLLREMLDEVVDTNIVKH